MGKNWKRQAEECADGGDLGWSQATLPEDFVILLSSRANEWTDLAEQCLVCKRHKENKS